MRNNPPRADSRRVVRSLAQPAGGEARGGNDVHTAIIRLFPRNRFVWAKMGGAPSVPDKKRKIMSRLREARVFAKSAMAENPSPARADAVSVRRQNLHAGDDELKSRLTTREMLCGNP